MSHDCIADTGCRASKTVAGERRPAITEKPDTLCPACFKHVGSAIRQLPRDWAELRSTLGEQNSSNGPRIRSTPAPVIPINTRKEALMSAIAETLDRAAAVVSDRLHTDQPDSRHGRRRYCGRFAPHERETIRACVALVEPNIDILAAAPTEAHVLWGGDDRIQDSYELADVAGIDIAMQLVDLHNQARSELGKTRLRHRYAMPCPHCGARVGRDDGTAIVDCDHCKSSWTEREYKFLAGLIVDERQDMEISKYLLAEAYSRLDDVQRRLDSLTDADLALPGAGVIIAAAIRQAVDGHKPPQQRTIATNRQAAEARQTDEDTWTWQNEPTYRPPRQRRRRKIMRPAGPTIPVSSLTLMVDIDEHAVLNGNPACPDCQMIHAGQCG